ncbi:porin [Ramlibacter albus]|uniref:Porin n=1 Tax=Ramlibacter albus TaxID=2079448 RepID=A0A923MBC0_9BURK|nr:porin [Ramlibacter albus]MBC5766243.1 porin [Ramlibacter albus]
MLTRAHVAALACLPAAALAQGSVSLFGIVDVNLLYGRGTIASRTQLAPGGSEGPRIGISGAEDLGQGYRAVFWAEGDVFPDSGRGVATNPNNQAVPGAIGAEGAQGFNFNRLVYVGLQAPWGRFRVGRDYTPTFAVHALYDPAGAGGLLGSQSAYSSLTVGGHPGGVRVSNSFAVAFGELRSGPLLHASFAMGENARDGSATARDGGYHGIRLAYTVSPVDVAFGWGRHKLASVGDLAETIFGARFEFGALNVWMLHVRDRTGTANSMRGSMLGATWPTGPWSLRVTASHGAQRNRAGTPVGTALKVGAGGSYSLSKRTSVYANVANTRNSHGAAAMPSGGIGQTAPNHGGHGRELGLRHTF